MKFIICFLYSIVLCSCLTNYPANKEINISYKIQGMENWCWANVSSMIYNYFYNQKTEDCEIASLYYKKYDCCAGDIKCNETIHIKNMIKLLENELGVKTELIYNPISFYKIVKNIHRDNLIIIIGLNSYNGHVYLISGYDKIKKRIIMIDPNIGKLVMSYSVSINSSFMGNWYWTIIVKKK